jgi:hypothetical protein
MPPVSLPNTTDPRGEMAGSTAADHTTPAVDPAGRNDWYCLGGRQPHVPTDRLPIDLRLTGNPPLRPALLM